MPSDVFRLPVSSNTPSFIFRYTSSASLPVPRGPWCFELSIYPNQTLNVRITGLRKLSGSAVITNVSSIYIWYMRSIPQCILIATTTCLVSDKCSVLLVSIHVHFHGSITSITSGRLMRRHGAPRYQEPLCSAFFETLRRTTHFKAAVMVWLSSTYKGYFHQLLKVTQVGVINHSTID